MTAEQWSEQLHLDNFFTRPGSHAASPCEPLLINSPAQPILSSWKRLSLEFVDERPTALGLAQGAILDKIGFVEDTEGACLSRKLRDWQDGQPFRTAEEGRAVAKKQLRLISKVSFRRIDNLGVSSRRQFGIQASLSQRSTHRRSRAGRTGRTCRPAIGAALSGARASTLR